MFYNIIKKRNIEKKSEVPEVKINLFVIKKEKEP